MGLVTISGEIQAQPLNDNFSYLASAVSAVATSTAASTLGYAVYNVKEAAYGAVGDGVTDDTAAIQVAIDAANAAGGGIIYFPDGTYLISSHLSLYSNISVFSDPGAIIRAQTAFNDKILYALGTIASHLSNIRLYNLTIQGNGASDTQSSNEFVYIDNLWISNCRVIDTKGYNPIQVHNSTGVHILDNYIESPVSSDSIALSASSHCEVRGNYCYDPYDTGVVLAAGCSHCNVEGNMIKRVGAGLTNAQAIAVADTTFSNIIGNTVEGGDAAQAGVRMYQDPNTLGYPSDCVVAGNTISAVGQNAISVGSSVDRISVANNLINGCGEHGINVYQGNHITINGNIVMNSAATNSGIILQGASYCNVTDNISSDDQVVHTQGYGIRLIDIGGVNSQYNTVSNNKAYGNVTLQLELGGSLKLDEAYNNHGYNPVGLLSAPPIPASTVAQTNTFQVQARVYVTGGTVTVIAINGAATGLTSGSFVLGPNETITLTYSVAPTWTWFGL